jgi:hypothetical protein
MTCHKNLSPAHNIITVYTTQSTMNLGRALSWLRKTNHSTYLSWRKPRWLSMFHQWLLLHYAVKMYEGRHSVITNVTCYCWAWALALWQRISSYQPIGGWFWNCPHWNRGLCDSIIRPTTCTYKSIYMTPIHCHMLRLFTAIIRKLHQHSKLGKIWHRV